jgi:predicted amidohydrolase
MMNRLLLVLLLIAGPGVAQEEPKVRIRVAGAQIPVGRDVAANVAAIGRAIDYAAAEKADILVTPEGSLSGYTHEFDQEAVARGLAEVLRRARDAKVALALGTCFREEDGQVYNEQRHYDKEGSYLGFHAKILRCRRMGVPERKGEVDFYQTKPLRTFEWNGLTVGGLICNDLWANPEYTPMDDPHLTQQLAKMGATLIFHSVNAGQSPDGEELTLVRAFHESNLKLRARSGRQWIVVANAADPKGERAGHVTSGVVDPKGKWAVQADLKGERFFAATIEIEK